ncbi:DUF5753 domain-containing protein [Actinokineospora auranticolor]|uniref:DUF5753 domain-containing protein n=1 Tax=Actinokineospora auranticolor TaxID=155976 RepID=A0A2S6GL58_9PSEU|nr:DUF5753 domain-containing protein [Actinokineospora auranticolor]PPK65968.1 hypothetical protein CLV40_112236 [Actinokineospora auranticolor]
MRSLDAEAMCRVYGASAEVTEMLKSLAKKTKSHGWWHAYSDSIPDGFALYIGLEEAASSLQWFQSDVVPGLFQTPDYARNIISSHNGKWSDEELDRRVTLRLARQPLLARTTARPTISVVLAETILRRPVGGPAVMGEQLLHLAAAAELDNVSMRVMPFGAGMNHGLVTGPFILFRFPGDTDREPPVVHVENFSGDLYLDKPDEIDNYSTAFQRIWTAALDEKTSVAWIRQAGKDFLDEATRG